MKQVFLRFFLFYYMPSSAMILLSLFLLATPSELYGQRITYETLRMRPDPPKAFIQHHVLPGETPSDFQLVSTFRMDYNFLNFRRHRGQEADGSGHYVAEPHVRLNIFSGKSVNEIKSLEGAEIREIWNTPVIASHYDSTQSKDIFVEDVIRTDLTPGSYTIHSQLTPDANQPRQPSTSQRSRRTTNPVFQGFSPSPLSIRFITIPESGTSTAFIYTLKPGFGTQPEEQHPLLNYGNHTLFGNDYDLLIWIPFPDEKNKYELQIDQLRVRRQDTTHIEQVKIHPLDLSEAMSGYRHNIMNQNGRPHLQLLSSDSDFGAFFIVSIPNRTYQNDHFRIQVKSTKPNSEPASILTSETVYNVWLDMPASLLNLDIAVDMMRFVVESDDHRTMRRASRSEKERLFRAFWEQRDPTPESEYNELMVEYFRRIDEAYDRFTTPQTQGFESDQGRVFIRSGEPDRIERVLPPGQPAREVWHYENRRFVFEATTGFGDYRLIE